MKRNGRPRPSQLEYDREVKLEQGIRQTRPSNRLGLFAWLQRWRRQPGRVFWEFDPTRGEWRRL